MDPPLGRSIVVATRHYGERGESLEAFVEEMRRKGRQMAPKRAARRAAG